MIQGAKIVHHIPGRLRVRLSRTQRNPHLLDQLRGFVESLEGVHSVEMNPVTGSIVVHYHPESRDDIQNLLRSQAAWFESPPGLTESDQLAEQIEKEAEFLAAHSELALHMVRSFRGLNDEIRRTTD